MKLKSLEINVVEQSQKAEIKYNNGNGALLCNGCRIIIAYGFDHDKEKAHYCKECLEGRQNGKAIKSI